jgi:hypothetical protein
VAAGRHWILTSSAIPKGHVVLGREPLTIGREPGCELRLYSAEVSRRHARITRTQSGYSIQDLGSANGTWVNGRSAMKPAKLEHEDLIAIGAVQLQFLIVDAERDQIAQRFSPGLDETDHVVQSAAVANALFAGKFTRETLHQVCQLIEFHQHAGLLRVEAGGCVGYLRFKEGLVVDARFGPATGEKAARSLLSSLHGDYAFYAWRPESPGAVAPGGSIRLQALAVVMEVLRAEESQEQRIADEGLLDELPGSDVQSIQRTQRMTRAALESRRAKAKKPEPPPPPEPDEGSSKQWKALYDEKS